MATHRHISVSFSIAALLLLTSSSPLSTVAEEDGGGSRSEWKDDGISNFTENTPITWKYGLVWTKSSLKASRYDFSHFNDDIDSVNCTSDANCTVALPGVEAALDFDTDLPSSPYCLMLDEVSNATTPGYVTGKCTCGNGNCVSYSRESKTGNPFYYCGPCGYVGSKCTHTCEHNLAECRGGYCECIQQGTFYDMTYCYIPFYGQEILINVLIATTILLLCCATLAYGYHKMGNRQLRRGSFYSENGTGTGRRESPCEDTPPAYDEVVMEKLPSYQDAIQMFEKGDVVRGLNNRAFEDDESSSHKPKTDQNSTTMAVTILQGDAEGQSSTVLEEDTTRPPSYQDTIAPKTESVALSPLNNKNASISLTSTEDIASFPESSAREDINSELTIVDEWQGLGTQPIEQLLYNALHTEQTTTSL